MKTLLINGCSFGECWNPSKEFISSLGMNNHVNISKAGTSFQRTVRSTIEWIAQNNRPDYVLIPITFAHRWELALNFNEDNIDGSWIPLQNSNYLSADYNLQDINISDLKDLVDRYYSIIPSIKTHWDKLFTEIILLASYLDYNRIPYVMWDMCNNFEKIHINGYKGFEKVKLINSNHNIIDLWSFCGNRFMWSTMATEEKNKIDQYAYHHNHEQYLHLEKRILDHIKTNRE